MYFLHFMFVTFAFPFQAPAKTLTPELLSNISHFEVTLNEQTGILTLDPCLAESSLDVEVIVSLEIFS